MKAGHRKFFGIKYLALMVACVVLIVVLGSGNAFAVDKSLASLISVKDLDIPDLGLALDKSTSYVSVNEDTPQIEAKYGNIRVDGIVMTIYFFSKEDIGKQDLENMKRNIDSGFLGVKNLRIISTSVDAVRCAYVYSGTEVGGSKITYGRIVFLDGPTEVAIEGVLRGDTEQQARDLQAMMDKVEAKAKELLKKGKPSITITHIHPFSTEALSDPLKGGDIIVKVVDDKGKPVANKQVFLFTERLNRQNVGSNWIYSEPIQMASHMWVHGHDISGFPAGYYQNPEDFWEGSVELRTDNNGVATYNYVDHIQYSILQDQIDKLGDAESRIWAFVFDKEHKDLGTHVTMGDNMSVTASDSVTIKFTSIAVIAAVMDVNSPVNVRHGDSNTDIPITSANVPYPINSTDRIRLGPASSVKIAWLSGERLSVADKWEKFKSAEDITEFTISTKDMGWLDTARRYGVTGLEYVHYAHLGLMPVVIYYEGGWVALKHGICFTIGTMGGEAVLEPGTEVEEVIEPILIVPHSGILIDFGNNSSSIYTLEGTAEVYRKDGAAVNVTTGHKMNVSQDGTFSQVSTFSQGQLDDEQKDLIEFAKETSGNKGSSGASICPCASLLAVVMLVTLVVYYRRK
jgi:hypothetical protein